MRRLIMRSEYGLKASARHAFAMQHALAIPKGIIYTYIPKNACTPIRYAAGIANGFVCDYPALANIQVSIQANFSEIRDAEYTFVLLRCPYRKIASMFLDKAINEPGRFKPVRNRIAGRIRRGIDHLSFRSFIERLQRPGALIAEHHWTPQSAFLIYHEYDDYFSVEEADAAFAQLNRRFAIKDTREFSGHSTAGLERVEGAYSRTTVAELKRLKGTGRMPSCRSMFDSETKKIIESLYHDDIALYRSRIGKTLIDY